MKVTVVGMRYFQGAVDGKQLDSGKLYTLCNLDESKGNAKGQFTEEWRLPNGETVKRLMHLPVPFEAELDISRVGNGREARELVLDVRPIGQAKPVTVKAAA